MVKYVDLKTYKQSNICWFVELNQSEQTISNQRRTAKIAKFAKFASHSLCKVARMKIPVRALCNPAAPPLGCWWRRNQTLELIILSQLLFAYLSTFHHQWLHVVIFYRDRNQGMVHLNSVCFNSSAMASPPTERVLYTWAAVIWVCIRTRFIKSGGGAAATISAPIHLPALNKFEYFNKSSAVRACTFRTKSNGELCSPLGK